METTHVSIKGWMDKENVILYTHIYVRNGIVFSRKEEENPAICSNIDGLGGHYAKSNKSDRERQILYDITYVWNKIT